MEIAILICGILALASNVTGMAFMYLAYKKVKSIFG